ncbi:hypothetical protein ACET3Z_003014 [Daucus carota]
MWYIKSESINKFHYLYIVPFSVYNAFCSNTRLDYYSCVRRILIKQRKLSYLDEKMAQPRRRWPKRMNIKLKGLRISGHRKLKLKAFSVALWPRKIAKLCADILDKIMKIDGACPGIIFSSQLGFPVLSHPTSECRRNALCFEKRPFHHISPFSVTNEVI